MNDQELIARLREGTWDHTVVRGPNPTGFCVDETPFIQETADRIEELVKGMDALQDRLDTANKARADAMSLAVKKQDKLAKAVEALRFYAPKTFGGITFVGDDAGKRAAAVLAELEEKK